jgi:hypothetical protein
LTSSIGPHIGYKGILFAVFIYQEKKNLVWDSEFTHQSLSVVSITRRVGVLGVEWEMALGREMMVYCNSQLKDPGEEHEESHSYSVPLGGRSRLSCQQMPIHLWKAAVITLIQ